MFITGAEYVSPGSTPLELAVEYFLAVPNKIYQSSGKPSASSCDEERDMDLSTIGEVCKIGEVFMISSKTRILHCNLYHVSQLPAGCFSCNLIT